MILVRHLLLNIRCTPEKRLGQQDVVVCECLLPPSAVGLAGSGAALGVTDGLETTLVKSPLEVLPSRQKGGVHLIPDPLSQELGNCEAEIGGKEGLQVVEFLRGWAQCRSRQESRELLSV